MLIEKRKIIEICQSLGGKLCFLDGRRPTQHAKAMAASKDYAKGFLAGVCMVMESRAVPDTLDDDHLEDELTKRFRYYLENFNLLEEYRGRPN